MNEESTTPTRNPISVFFQRLSQVSFKTSSTTNIHIWQVWRLLRVFYMAHINCQRFMIRSTETTGAEVHLRASFTFEWSIFTLLLYYSQECLCILIQYKQMCAPIIHIWYVSVHPNEIQRHADSCCLILNLIS